MRFRSGFAAFFVPDKLIAGLYLAVATLGMVDGGSWGAIGIGGALLAAFALFLQTGRFPVPDHRVLWGCAVFFLLGALSCLGAPDRALALATLFKLFTILLPLSLLSSPLLVASGVGLLPDADRLRPFLLAGGVVLGLLLLAAIGLYGYEDHAVTKLNRGFSYACGFLWPVLGFYASGGSLKLRKILGIVGLFGVLLLLTHSRAAQMGMGVAGLVWLLTGLWPRLALSGIGLGLLIALGWPFGVNYLFTHAHDAVYRLSGSWLHRIEIWDYLSYRLLEAPLFGWGLGCTGLLDWVSPHGAMYRFVALPAAHPHNALMQLWVEMGLGGAGVAVLLLVGVFYRVLCLPASLRPFGAAALAYFLVLSLSAYNLWTDSFLAAMALTGFAFSVLRDYRN